MTPIELSALRSAIIADPACADAVNAKDCHALAEIMSAGRVKTVKVLIADIQAYLQTHGKWIPIKQVAADPLHPAYVAALALLETATARFEHIDTSLPIVAQMVGGLVQAGVLSQVDSTAITSMGTVPDVLTAQDIADALFNADGSLK